MDGNDTRYDAVTIRDVAAAAGVSLSTVSRALNGGKNVSARAAADIAAAVSRLGYQPDLAARSLRTRTTGMVGCLVSDAANPLYASIVRAAETRLRDAGILLVVASTGNDPARELAALAEFRSRRLDGILIAPGSRESEGMLRDLARAGTSIIILDREPPAPSRGEEPWPAVLVDHRGGARAAAKYLLGLGHRRIALFTPGAHMRPGRERMAGFRQAFADAGVVGGLARVCIQESSMEFADAGARALLMERHRPTGIIALGTRILAGVLRAARDLGLSVPDDLSVISIGDTDLAAVHTPAITAVRWGLDDVGRAAAELLLQRLRHEAMITPGRALISVDLVVRESCSAPRKREKRPASTSSGR